MSKLKQAIAHQRELFTDTQHISHPYTDQHVNEISRRSLLIGAGLTGEDRTKYMALHTVGMRAIAKVQVRNSVDTHHDNGMIGTAGVEQLTPRWVEKLESLEYALGCFGCETTRSGDTAVTVSPVQVSVETASLEVLSCVLKPVHKFDVTGSMLRRIRAVVDGTYLEPVFAATQDTYETTAQDFTCLVMLSEEKNPGLRRELVETTNLR